ncbi:hypothetical protein NQ317_016414 [Molorchus minor]|uniref:Beta-galactosidase n=1 Tax=Molorchus minor TaxID=1323400 RepID=A0ABQ9K101_9CUCU|nr:hypothetical protein NQ317_016414 [Molorchus minor]
MESLPTLYEYYTSDGITEGLSVNQPYFKLNGKNITLYSGSMHYFRVPQEFWRDRLRKMRAAGLNAVETYVPWNLHEPEPGSYDFGHGGTDMQEFLDIEKFLKTAQEEDLLAIVRPGPFICAEFEFGGLPSWLLRERGIKFRTSDEKFMSHVTRYFNVLLKILALLQFTKGGPIIALQVENEYGSTEDTDANPPVVPDSVYVEQLRQLMLTNNITEILFTSDSPYDHGSVGSLPTLFQTANFNTDPEKQFEALKKLQKDKPSMATEFWSGWFSHWSEKPYEGNVEVFRNVYERILEYPASVNLYMFHGGTSWGFLNGANMPKVSQSTYQPDITSYDYDAPLTEYGDYNEKYHVVKELIEKYNPIKTRLPEAPEAPKRIAYPNVQIDKYLPYNEIIGRLPIIQNMELLSMEWLPINNNTGQKFGYIVYRKTNITITPETVLKIKGYVYDSVNVYINDHQTLVNATVDLMVENLGRNNYGGLDQFYQYKGLWEGVFLDDQEIFEWQIFPLEFKKSWTQNLDKWVDFDSTNQASLDTGLYKGTLMLNDTQDTFLDMTKWNKGMVIVNDFVLGRFWRIGPQQSLYLPAPLLRNGTNEIIVFEQFAPNDELEFSENPVAFNQYRKFG